MNDPFAAIAIIFNEDGNLLCVSRAPDDFTNWGFPGGKIEHGETPIEAVRREVKEETNLDIDVFEYVLTMDGVAVFLAPLPNAQYSTTGAGELKLGTWRDVTSGPFGKFNSKLAFKILVSHRTSEDYPPDDYTI